MDRNEVAGQPVHVDVSGELASLRGLAEEGAEQLFHVGQAGQDALTGLDGKGGELRTGLRQKASRRAVFRDVGLDDPVEDDCDRLTGIKP